MDIGWQYDGSGAECPYCGGYFDDSFIVTHYGLCDDNPANKGENN